VKSFVTLFLLLRQCLVIIVLAAVNPLVFQENYCLYILDNRLTAKTKAVFSLICQVPSLFGWLLRSGKSDVRTGAKSAHDSKSVGAGLSMTEGLTSSSGAVGS